MSENKEKMMRLTAKTIIYYCSIIIIVIIIIIITIIIIIITIIIIIIIVIVVSRFWLCNPLRSHPMPISLADMLAVNWLCVEWQRKHYESTQPFRAC